MNKPITPRRLKLRGYKWKIDHLTPEEMDWLQNGKPTDKPNIHGERPDYFYFYKEVENGECRIHKVGDWFLYNGVRIETMDKVAKCEELAKDGNKWAELQGRVEDTKPQFDINIQQEEVKLRGSIVIEFDHIMLIGGPLAGRKVKYNNKLTFYMTQINVGTEDEPNVIAVRYKRNAENKNQYDYERTF